MSDEDPYPAEWKHLARVTTIVRFAFPDMFKGLPEKDKDYYFSRGTQNHLAWQMVEEGTADGFDFDPVVQKYMPAHARFLRETGFRALPGGIEMRIKSDDLGIKGTIDRLGTIQDRVVLIDYKTTDAYPSTALQTALYLLMIPGYKFHDVERYGVGFRNDGTYKMTPKYPYTDKAEALYHINEYRKGEHNDPASH